MAQFYEFTRRQNAVVKFTKGKTFPGANINDNIFFKESLLKKKLDKVVVRVGTNDASHSTPNEMFQDLKELRLLV